MKNVICKTGAHQGVGDGAYIQASMSQVEMTVWLCVMAFMACAMLALLAMVGC